MLTRTLILLFLITCTSTVNAGNSNVNPAPLTGQARHEFVQVDVAAFFESIKQGDVAAVERLLAAGISANVKDDGGRPALLLAVQTGRASLIKALIDEGADVNSEYKTWTPLGLAAHNGRLQIVMLLIERGAQINLEAECHHTALILAAEGATLKATTDFMRARALVPEMTGEEDDELGDARDIGSDHLEIVKTLIERGADPNVASDCETGDWSATALVIAAIGGNAELVKILLAGGADPNRKTAASALWLLTHNHEMREEIDESDTEEDKLRKQALNDWLQSLKPAHAQIIDLLRQAGARDEIEPEE